LRSASWRGPIGALVFGHIGDRLGRKTAFVGALIVNGTATSLIGVLPTYRAAGGFSRLVLVLLRLTQGLAVGGQWGGSMLLATEKCTEGEARLVRQHLRRPAFRSASCLPISLFWG